MKPPSDRDLHRLLAPFRRKDDRLAFALLALDWLLVVAAIAVAARAHSLAVTLAAIVVVAGRQVAMMNLVHAASHNALFATASWNEGLEALFAWPILDSVAGYRGPHLEHHREIASDDAERFAFLHDELALPRRGAWGRTWIVFVRPLLGEGAWSFIVSTAKSFAQHRARAGRIAALWVVAIAIAVAVGGAKLLLIYWVLPLVWLNPVLLLWGEVADHFAARAGTRNHVGLFHAALTNGHALCHDLHHRFPTVPFYREREACAALAGAGVTMETTRTALGFVRGVYGEAFVVAPARNEASLAA